MRLGTGREEGERARETRRSDRHVHGACKQSQRLVRPGRRAACEQTGRRRERGRPRPQTRPQTRSKTKTAVTLTASSSRLSLSSSHHAARHHALDSAAPAAPARLAPVATSQRRPAPVPRPRPAQLARVVDDRPPDHDSLPQQGHRQGGRPLGWTRQGRRWLEEEDLRASLFSPRRRARTEEAVLHRPTDTRLTCRRRASVSWTVSNGKNGL